MDKKLLEIYKYGDDVLQLKAAEIKNIDEAFITLRQQMIDTMYSNPNAIGLAAPQVGQSLQLSVIDVSRGTEENGLLVLINPVILEADGGDVDEEGCLSFPGISVPIKRNTRIFLQNMDLDGKITKQEISGYLARVIQHEIDHLNGTLIIDRVSPLKRQLMKRDIKHMKKNDEW